jgi:TetR/AcrR family transcriptional regulator, acrAB operon repressor
MRRTPEQAAATREQLLEAALRVFSKKGYAATTLEEISKEAGFTRGALYWHFQSKAELFAALIQERARPAARVFEEAFAEGASPLAALKRLLVRSVELLEEDEDYRRALELSWLKAEITDELAPAFRKKLEGISGVIARLSALISRGVAEGEIRPSIDPDIAAWAAYALMGGLMTMHLMSPALLAPKPQAEEAIALFLDGLRAAAPR